MKIEKSKRTPASRAFGIALSLMIAVTMFPGTAPVRAAATGDGTVVSEGENTSGESRQTPAPDGVEEVSTWERLESIFSGNASASIKLTADINTEDMLVVSSNQIITIDMNGHTLDRGLYNTDNAVSNGSVIKVESGGTLTITDSSTDKNGKMTGGYSSDNGGCIINEGVLTVENISIEYNKTSQSGGAIYCKGRDYDSKASLFVSNCCVEYNISEGYYNGGGGIYLDTNSGMTIKGSSIMQNESSDGGGIVVSFSSATLENVTISNNKVTVNGGGGINNQGTLTLQGVNTITGNNISTGHTGGGIWNNGNINMQGTVIINDNTVGKTNEESEYTVDNLYLNNYNNINVTGELDAKSEIYVAVNDQKPCEFAEGESGTIPLDVFKCDGNGNYRTFIRNDSNNRSKVWIGEPCTVSFSAGEAAGSMESYAAYKGETYTLPECSFTAPDGNLFKCWSVNGQEKKPGDNIVVDDNITVEAVWLEGCFIRGASLSLNGEISVNMYFVVPDSMADEGAYFLIQGPNDSSPVKQLLSEIEPDEKGAYRAVCKVNAAQMGEEVSFKFYNGQDKIQLIWNTEKNKSYEIFKYSVNKYINDIKNRSDELGELAKSMQNYGSWARQYFINESKISETMAEIAEPITLDDITSDTLKEYSAVKSEGFSVQDLTMSLFLEFDNSLRLYYSGDPITATATLNGKAVNTVNGLTNSRQYVEIKNICAQDLDKKFIIDFGENGSIEVCALSYAYMILSAYEGKTEKTDICNTVKALYRYNEATKQYFEAKRR